LTSDQKVGKLNTDRFYRATLSLRRVCRGNHNFIRIIKWHHYQ